MWSASAWSVSTVHAAATSTCPGAANTSTRMAPSLVCCLLLSFPENGNKARASSLLSRHRLPAHVLLRPSRPASQAAQQTVRAQVDNCGYYCIFETHSTQQLLPSFSRLYGFKLSPMAYQLQVLFCVIYIHKYFFYSITRVKHRLLRPAPESRMLAANRRSRAPANSCRQQRSTPTTNSRIRRCNNRFGSNKAGFWMLHFRDFCMTAPTTCQ